MGLEFGEMFDAATEAMDNAIQLPGEEALEDWAQGLASDIDTTLTEVGESYTEWQEGRQAKQATETRTQDARRLAESYGRTGNTEALAAISQYENIDDQTAYIIFDKMMTASRYDDAIGQKYRIVNKNPKVAQLNLKEYKYRIESGDFRKGQDDAPVFLTGLPENLAQEAYDLAPISFARAFPGSPVISPEHRERFAQARIDYAQHPEFGGEPWIILKELYRGGTEEGLMSSREGLDRDTIQAIGQTILDAQWEETDDSMIGHNRDTDLLLRAAADSPSVIGPKYLQAILKEFVAADSQVVTPETVAIVAERVQTIYERGKISEEDYKSMKQNVRTINRWLEPDQRGVAHNILTRTKPKNQIA